MNLPFQLPFRWIFYVLGFFILSLCLLTVVGDRGALHLWRLRAEKTKLDEANYHLQKENEALRQRIAKLRTDDFYLEKMAREELNLVRPGEVIFRFPSSEARKSRGGAVSAAPSELPLSAAQKERR